MESGANAIIPEFGWVSFRIDMCGIVAFRDTGLEGLVEWEVEKDSRRHVRSKQDKPLK